MEKPILFSAPMVRAILGGQKTQTRRIAKLNESGRVQKTGSHMNWHLQDLDAVLACPYGQPGDRLWVRETWGCFDSDSTQRAICYRADAEDTPVAWLNIPEESWYLDGDYCKPTECWRPSIFMPRWASRISLEITNIRVQRLQDITEEDAKAEGCPVSEYHMADGSVDDAMSVPARGNFMSLWNSINAKRGFGWDVNPWVWAISFRRI